MTAANTLESFVAGHAPRPFALVGEGDDQDIEILAWGLDTGGCAYVVGQDGRLRGTFRSADRACLLLSGMATSVRLVWWPPPVGTGAGGR